jgi:hypothetical protein
MGNVTDPSNAGVPGATVVAANLQTGFIREAAPMTVAPFGSPPACRIITT